MLSHQLKQFKIDGEKTIIQNPTKAQKKEHEKCDFENYEVYAMDVLISTGEGMGKELDTKVSIYKKTEENYLLKLKTSRMFFAEASITADIAWWCKSQVLSSLSIMGSIPLFVKIKCPMIKTYISREFCDAPGFL